MPDLIAQGQRHHHRWRRRLIPGRNITVGRRDAVWTVPWDNKISRVHAALLWNGKRLEVTCEDSATNPIYFLGEPHEQFLLQPNEHFVIGNTTFSLRVDQPNVSVDHPRPVTEQTFTAEYLRASRFQNAEQQIDALVRLPELIGGALDDQELWVRLVSVALLGLPSADAIAVAELIETDGDTDVKLLHWDHSSQSEIEFSPSVRLIRESIASQQSIVHIWSPNTDVERGYTQSEGLDWAFCTPVLGTTEKRWVIYVSGGAKGSSNQRTTNPNDLKDYLKFTEIVASTIANLRENRRLQKQKTTMARFFSPHVMSAINQGHADVLEPKLTEISVMFCDLRGFSKRSEEWEDSLLELMHHVSEKLGVVTKHILDSEGVIGDFHGDAAMGFWGWPIRQRDSAERALLTAIRVQQEFRQASQHADSFQIGIGIASGAAVAGCIGTNEQEKVTAFGPVVNVASRLENLNRRFGTEILLDEETAHRLDSGHRLSGQLRKIASVRPRGMTREIVAFQLLTEPMLESWIETYDSALDDFVAGDWPSCQAKLDSGPVEDGPSEYLSRFIRYHKTPPDGWQGTIPFDD